MMCLFSMGAMLAIPRADNGDEAAPGCVLGMATAALSVAGVPASQQGLMQAPWHGRSKHRG